uniref:putative protein FAM47C n=1 Tax=Panthera onca TaxID=9690 RepID=UPI002953E6EA|nr:putative protein FAM47C [Panthera onca]
MNRAHTVRAAVLWRQGEVTGPESMHRAHHRTGLWTQPPLDRWSWSCLCPRPDSRLTIRDLLCAFMEAAAALAGKRALTQAIWVGQREGMREGRPHGRRGGAGAQECAESSRWKVRAGTPGSLGSVWRHDGDRREPRGLGEPGAVGECSQTGVGSWGPEGVGASRRRKQASGLSVSLTPGLSDTAVHCESERCFLARLRRALKDPGVWAPGLLPQTQESGPQTLLPQTQGSQPQALLPQTQESWPQASSLRPRGPSPSPSSLRPRSPGPRPPPSDLGVLLPAPSSLRSWSSAPSPSSLRPRGPGSQCPPPSDPGVQTPAPPPSDPGVQAPGPLLPQTQESLSPAPPPSDPGVLAPGLLPQTQGSQPQALLPQTQESRPQASSLRPRSPDPQPLLPQTQESRPQALLPQTQEYGWPHFTGEDAEVHKGDCPPKLPEGIQDRLAKMEPDHVLSAQEPESFPPLSDTSKFCPGCRLV